jgi:hypothetical protein
MALMPVAIDYIASLRPIARLKIGVVAEPSDERIGVGLDKAGCCFSGPEPSE